MRGGKSIWVIAGSFFAAWLLQPLWQWYLDHFLDRLTTGPSGVSAVSRFFSMTAPAHPLLLGISIGMMLAFTIGYWPTIRALPRRITTRMRNATMRALTIPQRPECPVSFGLSSQESYFRERGAVRQIFFRLFVQNNTNSKIEDCKVILHSINGNVVSDNLSVIPICTRPTETFLLGTFSGMEFEVFDMPADPEKLRARVRPGSKASLMCLRNGAVVTMEFPLDVTNRFTMEFSGRGVPSVQMKLRLCVDGKGKAHLEASY